MILHRSALHLLLPAAVALAAGTARAGDDFDTPFTQTVIVQVKPDFTIAQVNAEYGSTTLASLTIYNEDGDPGNDLTNYLIQLPPGLTAAEFLDGADDDERIEEAEFDFVVGNPDPGTQSFFLSAQPFEFWGQPGRGIVRLDQPIGQAAPRNQAARGQGMIVAVVDSGVDAAHPLFAGRLQSGGLSFVVPGQGDGSVAALADAPDGADSDGDGLADEMVGHGTFAAGMVALAAPEAMILPMKVLDSDGRGSVFAVAQAIEAAADAGADVISLSLGTTAVTRILEDVILNAEQRGIIIVASVGNDGVNDPLRYPSAIPTAIGVASTDDSDVVASFSNFGGHVDLCAPGVSVVGPIPGGGYGRANGTSWSSALVAGVAAIVKAEQPAASPQDIKSLLGDHAVNIQDQNPGFDSMLGEGRIDVRAALAAIGKASPRLSADLDGSDGVDFADLNVVLSQFGSAGSVGDIDGDGVVTFSDLNGVLILFGAQY